jgi:hypothetical protein
VLASGDDVTLTSLAHPKQEAPAGAGGDRGWGFHLRDDAVYVKPVLVTADPTPGRREGCLAHNS